VYATGVVVVVVVVVVVIWDETDIPLVIDDCDLGVEW